MSGCVGWLCVVIYVLLDSGARWLYLYSYLLLSSFKVIYFCLSFFVCMCIFFFFQAEDGIRDIGVTGVQTCALPISEASDEVFAHAITALGGHVLNDLEESRSLVGELRSWAKERGIKGRDLLHPLRLALTGRDRGPEMARLFVVLGTEEVRERIERAREARLGA